MTNQRETALVWDRATGQALAPAIVWQCRRTAEACAALRDEGWTEHVRAFTPQFDAATRAARYAGWQRATARCPR